MSAKRRLDVVDQSRPIETPYLTSEQAVAYLGLPSVGALYHHIRENRLPVRRIGRSLRFDKRELDQWLAGATAFSIAQQRKQA